MTVRFRADADLNQYRCASSDSSRTEPQLSNGIRRRHYWAFRSGCLAVAADDGRLLVTHDRRTMPRHFADFIAHRTSAGLLVVRQSLPLSTVVDDLLLIHAATEAEEWINRVVFLPL